MYTDGRTDGRTEGRTDGLKDELIWGGLGNLRFLQVIVGVLLHVYTDELIWGGLGTSR